LAQLRATLNQQTAAEQSFWWRQAIKPSPHVSIATALGQQLQALITPSSSSLTPHTSSDSAPAPAPLSAEQQLELQCVACKQQLELMHLNNELKRAQDHAALLRAVLQIAKVTNVSPCVPCMEC
jgi:hypothetical protein